jgi:Tol biopolymer transport system component
VTLQPGARLGPYEITGAIGAGGMGEVFRARDTKLNRDVAIKVLPAAFADDPERLARFTREAQTLASLNHPNIATIHGIEEVPAVSGSTGPGSRALVMELVEGEDLSAHIARGPLPVAEALPIARQIAEALEAAHEQGIVHRDLKPANIKVRTDGTVKVLDFGLAKAMDPAGASSNPNVSHSPTLTHQGTSGGMIIGTAAYMSPEQAKGKTVDKRTDIWAFGVVLYEMLTGQRAFKGDDVSETLASVLKDKLSMDALPVTTPPRLKRLIERCLDRDLKRRLRDIGEARIELDEAAVPGGGTAPVAPRPGISIKERWAWASVAGLALVAVAALMLRPSPERDVTAPVIRFALPSPADVELGAVPRMAISPDGQSLVFAAARQDRGAPLWLRRLDSSGLVPIAGSEGAGFPFWSPDSRQVAFFMESPKDTTLTQLRIADLQGGLPHTIVELPSLDPAGSWNADGVLLFASRGTTGIQRISADGGPLLPVTALDSSRGEVFHLYPQFLPDGRHFIFQVQTSAREARAIFIGSIDSKDRRQLVQSDYARFAAPNLLVYTQGSNLVAQAVDLDRLTLTGKAVVIAPDIASIAINGRAAFSVSQNGVLVYKSNPEQRALADRRLTWVDRKGQVQKVVGPTVTSSSVRLSPDGARVALLESRGESLWVADLEREVKAPVLQTPAFSPTWAADGRRLLIGLRTGAIAGSLAERDASGATPVKTLLTEQGYTLLVPFDETRDGNRVVFGRRSGNARRGLAVLSRPDGKVTTYLDNAFTGGQAALSPDERWLAYTSNESGVGEVVVQPFPDPSSGKWPVSTGGGSAPRWRRDGRELFYVDKDRRLVSVPVNGAGRFELGRATSLFTLPAEFGGGADRAYYYDVAADGQRFLLSVPPGGASGETPESPLSVIANWTSLLKDLKR